MILPITFEFKVENGTTIYWAMAILFAERYRILGPEVDCTYTLDEVLNFIKIGRWEIVK